MIASGRRKQAGPFLADFRISPEVLADAANFILATREASDRNAPSEEHAQLRQAYREKLTGLWRERYPEFRPDLNDDEDGSS